MSRIPTRRPALLLIAAGCLAAGAAGAFPLTPSEFGTGADRIDFDDLALGTELTFHLDRLGVRLHLGSSGLFVADDEVTGVVPRSGPHALALGEPPSEEAPLELVLSSPRSRVGVFLGGVSDGTAATLAAYDNNDEILDEVEVTLTVEDAGTVASFVGIGIEEALIRRVTLRLDPAPDLAVLDDLLLEPSHDTAPVEPWRSDLLSPALREHKLEAIAELQLIANTPARLALEEALLDDVDPVVRERAALALAQVRDPRSLPALSATVESTTDPDVEIAARHAIHDIRLLFPLPGAPTVQIEVEGTLEVDEEIWVTATVSSPVEREEVGIRFRGSSLLTPIHLPDERPDYRGPLAPDAPVTLTRGFRILQAGTETLVAEVQMAVAPGDLARWDFPLYLQTSESEGSASMQPPEGWSEDDVLHVIVGTETD